MGTYAPQFTVDRWYNRYVWILRTHEGHCQSFLCFSFSYDYQVKSQNGSVMLVSLNAIGWSLDGYWNVVYMCACQFQHGRLPSFGPGGIYTVIVVEDPSVMEQQVSFLGLSCSSQLFTASFLLSSGSGWIQCLRRPSQQSQLGKCLSPAAHVPDHHHWWGPLLHHWSWVCLFSG